jgi:hypothetical protein
MSPLRSRHLAAVVLPLALAACSAEPATPPPFTPGTSASSPSASVTAHAETAEEFIRRWHQLGNDMELDGKTADYLQLTSSCTSCNTYADTVDRIYEHGGYIRTEGERILRINRHAGLTYDVRFESEPIDYNESSSAAEKHLPGG